MLALFTPVWAKALAAAKAASGRMCLIVIVVIIEYGCLFCCGWAALRSGAGGVERFAGLLPGVHGGVELFFQVGVALIEGGVRGALGRGHLCLDVGHVLFEFADAPFGVGHGFFEFAALALQFLALLIVELAG